MTTQLEQDVKLAESVGFMRSSNYITQFYTNQYEIHALCNAIREQAVPTGWQLAPLKASLAMAKIASKDFCESHPDTHIGTFMRAYELMLSAAPTREEG